VDLESYRELVRTVDCPFCGADPCQPCWRVGVSDTGEAYPRVGEPVDYVHDNRSLAFEVFNANQANLGLATTGQLLDEVRARIELDYYSGGGGLEYSTVKGRPKFSTGFSTGVDDARTAVSTDGGTVRSTLSEAKQK